MAEYGDHFPGSVSPAGVLTGWVFFLRSYFGSFFFFFLSRLPFLHGTKHECAPHGVFRRRGPGGMDKWMAGIGSVVSMNVHPEYGNDGFERLLFGAT